MPQAAGFKVEGVTKLVRELSALGLEVDDLKDAFSEIADEGAKLAAGFAPRRSGNLASSIRGNRAKSKAVVSAGYAKKVPYAGAINYGWGSQAFGFKHGRYASGIKGSHSGSFFMQRADEAMRPRAILELEQAINRKIRERGLA